MGRLVGFMVGGPRARGFQRFGQNPASPRGGAGRDGRTLLRPGSTGNKTKIVRTEHSWEETWGTVDGPETIPGAGRRGRISGGRSGGRKCADQIRARSRLQGGRLVRSKGVPGGTGGRATHGGNEAVTAAQGGGDASNYGPEKGGRRPTRPEFVFRGLAGPGMSKGGGTGPGVPSPKYPRVHPDGRDFFRGTALKKKKTSRPGYVMGVRGPVGFGGWGATFSAGEKWVGFYGRAYPALGGKRAKGTGRFITGGPGGGGEHRPPWGRGGLGLI